VKDARESAAGMRQEPLDKPNLLARLIEMIESALDMAVCAREMVRDGAVCLWSLRCLSVRIHRSFLYLRVDSRPNKTSGCRSTTAAGSA
jgi:hypothetical protein